MCSALGALSYVYHNFSPTSEEPAIAVVPEPIHHVAAPVVPAVAQTAYLEPEPAVELAPVVAPAPAVAPAVYAAPAPVLAAQPAPIVAAAPVQHIPYPVVSFTHSCCFVLLKFKQKDNLQHIHHYNPRTEVRNVASHYSKGSFLRTCKKSACFPEHQLSESGHTSATAMVSGDHHAFSDMDFHPVGHFFDQGHEVAPLRTRMHRQKLASKKVARKHKTFEKN